MRRLPSRTGAESRHLIPVTHQPSFLPFYGEQSFDKASCFREGSAWADLNSREERANYKNLSRPNSKAQKEDSDQPSMSKDGTNLSVRSAGPEEVWYMAGAGQVHEIFQEKMGRIVENDCRIQVLWHNLMKPMKLALASPQGSTKTARQLHRIALFVKRSESRCRAIGQKHDP